MWVVNIIKSILGPTWCQLHWTKVRNEGACEDNICKPLLCPINIIMWSSRDMHVHVNALCDPNNWLWLMQCNKWLRAHWSVPHMVEKESGMDHIRSCSASH